MSIITPERAGEIRGELCEKYGATWLHEYAPAIERAVLKELQSAHNAHDAFHRLTVQQRDAAWLEVEVLQEKLIRIYELAHNKSTGPAVPDTYWEIRNIAQEAL